MAANGPSPEKPLGEPQSLPYYFPDLRSLTEVVELLSYHIEVNGAFILRNSSSGTNYTITVVHNGGVKHIKIQADQTGYRLAKRSFESLSDLITYYGTHDVPNVEAVASVRLTHPVSRDYINSNETSLPSPTLSIPPTPKPRFQPDKYIGTVQVEGGTISRQRSDSSLSDFNSGKSSPVTTLRSPRLQNDTKPEFPKVPPSPTQANIRGQLENLKPTNTGVPAKSWSNGVQGGSPPEGRARAVRPPPPPPIPTTPAAAPPTIAPPSPHANLRQSPYDYAVNINHNHTEDLIMMLRLTERCECGLYIHDATLPGGWTLHLTENSERKVFFVSPQQQSSWLLPDEIIASLEPQHKAVLKKYNAL